MRLESKQSAQTRVSKQVSRFLSPGAHCFLTDDGDLDLEELAKLGPLTDLARTDRPHGFKDKGVQLLKGLAHWIFLGFSTGPLRVGWCSANSILSVTLVAKSS